MAKQYYSVLTTYGSQQLATAIASRQPLNITHFAVGDGNGQAVTPNVSRTTLVHEVHRATVSAVSRDPRNNKQVIFELTIPENVGGFHIREMGIFDNQNKLIAYANCPESFKPTLDSGSGKVQVMRMILLIESSDAVTMKIDNTVIFGTREQLNPKTITESSTNVVDENGHSHQIAKASTTVRGIVKLTDELNLNDSTIAATAKAVKTLADRIAQAIRMLSNYIPNSKKSSAVNSDSEDTVGTSKAVKIAYDRAIEAEKKGLPVGAVLGFPREITNPQGFLKCDGSTFNQRTLPDLYSALGNKNKLPNLQRSDVGMLVYFPQDNIPDGWLACDGSSISANKYPELTNYLNNKYGSNKLPNAEDRFIRNAANGLIVGQTQSDAIRNITGGIDATYGDKSVLYTEASGAFIAQDVGVNRYSFYTSNHMYRGKDIKFDASRVVPTADENRPKSIVFKLCIKAHNTFDDVQFWIKAFGVVENVGRLDAGRLAQDIQQVSVKNQQLEDSFNQNKEQTSLKIQQIENQLNEKNQSGVVWSGNVTQHSTNVIQLSESILNKTVIFYLQQSQSHSLSQNVNVHIALLYVDGGIMDAVGKKYCHGGLYVGGWKNCQIEILSATQIRIVDLSGMYLKKITVA